MEKLEYLRKKIDEIDGELVRLIEKRLDIVEEVGRYKIQHNMPIFHEVREKEVLKKNIEKVLNKSYARELEDVLTSVMSISKRRQRMIMYKEEEGDSTERNAGTRWGSVGYQGVRGSFGEQAMLNFFGNKEDSRNYESFGDLISAVAQKEVDYGVLPVENSSTGSINEVYDLIRLHNVYIIGEEVLKIQQNLMGVRGTGINDIKVVYSHEQGFLQSSEFFRENPQMELIPCRNTALGAKYVSDSRNKSKAAVASFRAAEIYGLEIIRENLNGNSNNSTRFAIIGREPNYDKEADKISIILTIANKVGELQSILKVFSEHNLNLIKIESRPIQERPWEYFFYIDIEGNLEKHGLMDMMAEIKSRSTFFKILGNYKKSPTVMQNQ